MRVFPVVHIQNPEQALQQTDVALQAGADGVFLIDHSFSGIGAIAESFNTVADAHPDAFIGLNYLTADPLSGYEITNKLLQKGMLHKAPSALWFDDATAGVDDVKSAVAFLKQVQQYRKESRMNDVTFYGGVSFKYTKSYTENPNISAHLANLYAPYIDIVTTSGAGTGMAPSPEKITGMKSQPNVGRLAVASGIAAENIGDYNGKIDDALVATSVETEPYSGIFVPAKLVAFIATAKHAE